ICAKIEQKLERKDSGIVEINFPAGEPSNLKLCEDIHNVFNTEIIGDSLFINCNNGEKEIIHRKLANSVENQNQYWWTSNNNICIVRNNQYRPDVGVWFRFLTCPQRRMPITYTCSPPNI
ncbi:4729_t:CDS:2, partial [Dentiscutata erythropus]